MQGADHGSREGSAGDLLTKILVQTRMTVVNDVEYVAELERASAILHPLRLRILERAREPASAATIAGQLDLPRQKVNYHVRALADARLLRKAGTHKKRNMVEQRYVATARAYVLAPELLGPLEAVAGHVEDALSAGRLIALASAMQSDLARVTRAAAADDKRVATMSMTAELRFRSPAERARFADALREAVTRVVAEHAGPMRDAGGGDAPGRPFRLTLGCYPMPKGSDR